MFAQDALDGIGLDGDRSQTDPKEMWIRLECLYLHENGLAADFVVAVIVPKNRIIETLIYKETFGMISKIL